MLFSRPDGTLASDVHPFRKMMPYIMQTRNESAVYFEQMIDLTKTNVFIEEWNTKNPDKKITVFHLFLHAVAMTLHERPRLNRFIMGHKVWQRDGVWISFSAKKRLEDGSPIVVLKRRFEPGLKFEAILEAIYGDLKEGRGDKKSHVDKELSLFLSLPGPLLNFGTKVLKFLDSWNLLPWSFIKPDPMYTSMFIANLGSVKLDSAYHHLYEYGNCPFFAVIGQAKQVVTPEGIKPMCSIKYSFDERIEDGLYCAKSLELAKQRIENPSL
jgi:hypothetical protein